LELELLARRPLDWRSASQRQADIHSRRAAPSTAPRRLLPPFDEGEDLRVGWLDHDGRAHWVFGSRSSSSGDHFEGTHGPSLRTVLHFPPLFDHASVVLAWPEIGFPETVVELPLPDRATVERDTVSIWQAPLSVRRAPGSLKHSSGAFSSDDLPVEAGRIVALPQVLSRGGDAAVVLTRLTALGEALSMETFSVATGDRADALTANAFEESRRSLSSPDDAEHLRARGPGASIAVVHGHDAVWVRPHGVSSNGGRRAFESKAEFMVTDSATGILALVVAWPAAGLPDVHVEIPRLDRR
jgi:hypothetical protein